MGDFPGDMPYSKRRGERPPSKADQRFQKAMGRPAGTHGISQYDPHDPKIRRARITSQTDQAKAKVSKSKKKQPTLTKTVGGKKGQQARQAERQKSKTDW